MPLLGSEQTKSLIKSGEGSGFHSAVNLCESYYSVIEPGPPPGRMEQVSVRYLKAKAVDKHKLCLVNVEDFCVGSRLLQFTLMKKGRFFFCAGQSFLVRSCQ